MGGVFEKVVRPAQLGDISPAPIPSSGSGSGTTAAKTTTVTFGGSAGSVKQMIGSQTIDQTYYAIKKPREQKKTQ